MQKMWSKIGRTMKAESMKVESAISLSGKLSLEALALL
jgi:hypothetical protein